MKVVAVLAVAALASLAGAERLSSAAGKQQFFAGFLQHYGATPQEALLCVSKMSGSFKEVEQFWSTLDQGVYTSGQMVGVKDSKAIYDAVGQLATASQAIAAEMTLCQQRAAKAGAPQFLGWFAHLIEVLHETAETIWDSYWSIVNQFVRELINCFCIFLFGQTASLPGNPAAFCQVTRPATPPPHPEFPINSLAWLEAIHDALIAWHDGNMLELGVFHAKMLNAMTKA